MSEYITWYAGACLLSWAMGFCWGWAMVSIHRLLEAVVSE